VPGPDGLAASAGQAFPGVEMRPVPGDPSNGDVPVALAWHRFDRALKSQAANQAVLVWATCGEIIGLAMRPHRQQVHIEDAHRTLSTGVIGHTVHFTDAFDVSEWLLIVTEATKAGSGRVYGDGQVFTRSGSLVATFHQDAMARAVEGPMDPKRAM
jgi:acyl-CoA thioesterase II